MHMLVKKVVILITAKLNTVYDNFYLQNIFGKGYSGLQPNIFYNTF